MPLQLKAATRHSLANQGAMKVHQSALAPLPCSSSRPGLPVSPQVSSSMLAPSKSKNERSGASAMAASNQGGAGGFSPLKPASGAGNSGQGFWSSGMRALGNLQRLWPRADDLEHPGAGHQQPVAGPDAPAHGVDVIFLGDQFGVALDPVAQLGRREEVAGQADGDPEVRLAHRDHPPPGHVGEAHQHAAVAVGNAVGVMLLDPEGQGADTLVVIAFVQRPDLPAKAPRPAQQAVAGPNFPPLV